MRILKGPDGILGINTMPVRLKWSRWNDEIKLDSGSQVVFNTLHRSAILVSSDFNPKDYSSTLYRLGMLVDEDFDELSAFEKHYIEAKRDMSYIDLTVLTTKRCQFGCIYCFEGGKSNKSLTTKTMDDVMNFLFLHTDVCRKLRVTWFGGEPLLGYKQMQHFSKRLISFCDKFGIGYSADITTNGFALTPERCNELVNKMRVHRFIITLDGLAKVHDSRRPLLSGSGTFNKIWENISLLLDANAQVTIRMTIDRGNVQHIPSFLDSISKNPISNRLRLAFCRTIDFGFTPASVKGSIYSEKEFADVEWDLMQYARKLGLIRFGFPHAAPQGGCLRDGDIVIGTDGEIYKCLDTLGDEKWITGNIANTEITPQPDWYKKWLEWTPCNSTLCRNCKLIPLCSGGCPHNALFREKMHGTDSGCPDWKANYQRKIKIIAEEYEQTI